MSRIIEDERGLASPVRKKVKLKMIPTEKDEVLD
jgi:hypothetical protein